MTVVRICIEPRCTTELSGYNPGPYCWAHSEVPMAWVDPPWRVMSPAFLANVPGSYDDVSAEKGTPK